MAHKRLSFPKTSTGLKGLLARISKQKILSVVILSVAIVSLIAILSGCTTFEPSAKLIVNRQLFEVVPEDGARVVAAGIGSKISKLEVLVNGTVESAELDDNGYVLINGKKSLEKDTVYQLNIWVDGINDSEAYRDFAFRTIQTPQPEISDTPQTVRFDGGITIDWNIPIKGFTYQLPDGMQSRLKISLDGKKSRIQLINYEQAKSFDLRITDALAMNSQRLNKEERDYVQRIVTTTPLAVDVSPHEGALRVPRGSEIVMTFEEEIANPERVQDAFSVSPHMDGDVTWISSNEFKFTPKEKWDYDTEVTVALKGGAKSLIGTSGNYINGKFSSKFITAPYKLIDINLSSQTIVCYEDGVEVFSCLCATGKAGYRTPPGDYRVYLKQYATDMRNTPDMGEEYLVTDVPYVLWFYGGHAIHGCYWSNSYGSPRSHGCVNVTVSNASWIFDWAPVGTPVVVHY